MNEVEKMYENCNIKPKQKGYCDMLGAFCPYPHHDCGDKCPCWKYEDEAKYPPFTAEKQLELIKWFAHKAPNGLLINKHITNSGASMVFDDSLFASTFASSSISFEECLANLVNNAWIDLLKEERKQIKEILE